MAAPSYWNQAAGGNSVKIWIFSKIILISLIISNKNPQKKGQRLKQASLSLVLKKDYRGSVCTKVFMFWFIVFIAYLVIPAFNAVSATHTIHWGTIITAPTALHKRKRETNQTANNFQKHIKSTRIKEKIYTKLLHNSGSQRNQNFDLVSSFL